jgi:hypothetical protein
MSSLCHKLPLAIGAALVLTVLTGCPGRQPSNPTDKKPDPEAPKDTGPVTPLIDLLAQLPKEQWPKDESDRLRMIQAGKWFEKNLVDRRARHTLSASATRTFSAGENGKFDVGFYGRPIHDPENLYGGKVYVSVVSSGAGLGNDSVAVNGLTEKAAERLRAKMDPPEIIFNIREIEFLHGKSLQVTIRDVTIKGIGP